MKSKSTAIIPVPTKALPVPKTLPKVSKADIIKAMLARAWDKHTELSEEHTKKKEELSLRITTEAFSCLSKGGAEDLEFDSWRGRSHEAMKTAPIKANVTSSAMRKLLKEWFELGKKDPGYFNGKRTLETIKASMDPTQDRVDLILAQPDNVETIDKLLGKIFKKSETIIES